MMRGKRRASVFLSVIFLLIGAVAVVAAEVTPAEEAKKVEQKAEEAKPTTDLTVSVLSAYISKGDELPIMLCTA